MDKEQIKAALDEKGVEYDARWSAERLQALLDGEDAPQAPTAPETVPCVVLRDFWPTESEMDRVRAGTIIELEPMDAIDRIEAGLVRRVK